MVNFGHHYSSAAPVLTILAQPHYQTQLSAGTFGRQSLHRRLNMILPEASTPVPSASRKRSRDEASINLEPDQRDSSVGSSQSDWVYGEGMVIIKPDNGYVADASSQSGTWLEEKTDKELQAQEQHQLSSPDLRSHKSQRLNHSASDVFTQSSASSAMISPPVTNSSSPNGESSVVIDNFTLHLGIGWREVKDDDHFQAAARGWARFIENNFGLSNVRICLESKGLQSYLVEASEGYFLFAENLRHGRLVSRTADCALRNLQTSPPTFDGLELQILARDEAQPPAAPMDAEMVID